MLAPVRCESSPMRMPLAEFYRDVLGLPERAAFEGDGGARVAILDAGQATLELSNPAQVRLIDAAEADGTPVPASAWRSRSTTVRE